MLKMAIYTEAEAKAKWCPFARQPGRISDMKGNTIAYVSQNRGMSMGGALDDSRCLASGCMAWRWAETHVPDATGELVKNGETYGYCGMAGETP